MPPAPLENLRTPARWLASADLLAWAVRHGETDAGAAVNALETLATSAPALVTKAAAQLWSLVAGDTRLALRDVVRAAAEESPVTALAAWLATLHAAGETAEAASLARRLATGARAHETCAAWAPHLAAADVAPTLARAQALTGAAREAVLSSLAARICHGNALGAFDEAASTLAPDARDRVWAAALAAVESQGAGDVGASELVARARAFVALEAPGAGAPRTAFRLASLLPPEEGLPLAFDALLQAEAAGAACLAEVSPFVPEPLVDEAVKRQRKAQSPARPRALAALAARTHHPAVRQRLFHEAYHETRYRKDADEARRVILAAATCSLDDALAWAESLPTTPELVTTYAEVLGSVPHASSSRVFEAAFARLTSVAPAELATKPGWSDALIVLGRLRGEDAGPSHARATVLATWAVATPLAGELALWEALAPGLSDPWLAELLVRAADFAGPPRANGPAGDLGPSLADWWKGPLVHRAPAALVRAAVDAAENAQATTARAAHS